jgi:hypothetical protein
MRIRGIRRAIVVHTRRTATGRDTTVSIDHLIPEPSADIPTAVWRISSRPARLRASEFVNAAAVNQCFAERRGRAIACVDNESSTTMAAIAYHIDPDEDRPVLLRTSPFGGIRPGSTSATGAFSSSRRTFTSSGRYWVDRTRSGTSPPRELSRTATRDCMSSDGVPRPTLGGVPDAGTWSSRLPTTDLRLGCAVDQCPRGSDLVGHHRPCNLTEKATR